MAVSERPRSLLDGELQHKQDFFPRGAVILCLLLSSPSVALSVSLTPCPASQSVAKFLWMMLAPVNPLPGLGCCFSLGAVRWTLPSDGRDRVGRTTCPVGWKPWAGWHAGDQQQQQLLITGCQGFACSKVMGLTWEQRGGDVAERGRRSRVCTRP